VAYNAISGTLIAAQDYIPGDLVVENTVSGTFAGDGSDILFVPRVSNATNNAILTNVGGDANNLTCESNLTFDGTTLNITGDLTASVGLSASFLYGDGRYLTNITGTGGGSGGPLDVEQYGAPPLGTTLSASVDFALIKSGSATGIGGATYTLPSATEGKKIFVKLSASVANVTVSAASGDRIEGGSTGNSIYLESTGSAVTLVAFNTSDWWIV
jgi:hypothetical protein